MLRYLKLKNCALENKDLYGQAQRLQQSFPNALRSRIGSEDLDWSTLKCSQAFED